MIKDHAGCGRTVIHCKDFKELKNELISMRSTSNNHIVKVGIDGGGGFLKEFSLNMRDQDFVLSCDLKLANIICGLQAHSSAHPCTWCESSAKDLLNQGKLRTFHSLDQNVSLFNAAGSNIKRARDYMNVVHSPVFDLAGGTLVLDFIPPMELHLLIGVFNHLFAALLKVFPQGTL